MAPDDAHAPPHPLSRRSFLRTAAVGTGAALAATALDVLPAQAAEKTSGTIELSALPVTYISAPLFLKGAISWAVTKQRTDTLSLASEVNRSVSLAFDRSAEGLGFTVAGNLTLNPPTADFGRRVVGRDGRSGRRPWRPGRGLRTMLAVLDAFGDVGDGCGAC